ncbi:MULTISPECIES: hypothetical protein [Flavobacterium]|uniref:hypothetical protein n=1 Tax=Flavobacterium TaxID=237 RepID=UPI00118417D2|nr:MULTISPECIES: hypothetical protein [Flavobacterium]MCR4032344.1 hypothetical protein [Flavobacterium panacis]
MKLYFIFFINILFVSNLFSQSNVEGLTIKFKKISEDYIIPGQANGPLGASLIEAREGMKFVKLKVTLKNEGTKNCVFNFEDVYISTEQDSLYRFHSFQGYFVSAATKIKPQKEIDRILLFEFDDKMTPKELFIEDKRYRIIQEKK